MRTIYLTSGLILLLAVQSCKDLSTEPIGPYDYMVLKRTGAGNLGFNVFPRSDPDSFQVQVTHLDFRDTTIELVLVRSDTNTRPFAALSSALKGEAQIFGDFRQSSLPTGTWVRVYMVKGSRNDEVTDVDLRNELLAFEQMVRRKL